MKFFAILLKKYRSLHVKKPVIFISLISLLLSCSAIVYASCNTRSGDNRDIPVKSDSIDPCQTSAGGIYPSGSYSGSIDPSYSNDNNYSSYPRGSYLGDSYSGGSYLNNSGSEYGSDNRSSSICDRSAQSNSVTSFEPYVDITSPNAKTLIQNGISNGITKFTIAFFTAAPGCKTTIAGQSVDNYSEILDFMKSKKDAGITFRVSYGGAFQQDPAAVCSNATEMSHAIVEDLHRINSRSVDFDVETGLENNKTANQVRAQAIKLLKEDNYDVTVTISVAPTGLTEPFVGVLQPIAEANTRPNTVNIMTMDYYGAFDNDKNVEENSEAAVLSTLGQISSIFHVSKNDARAMLGATPMIGINDDTKESWDKNSFKKFADFLKDNNIRYVSMWSLARDKHGEVGKVSPTHSGTDIEDGFFQKTLLDI